MCTLTCKDLFFSCTCTVVNCIMHIQCTYILFAILLDFVDRHYKLTSHLI